jgi:hypothetical protein
LTPDNVLWQVAGSLNNLLSRLQRLRQFELEMRNVLPQFQRLRQSELELQLTKEEIALLAAVLHKARAEKRLPQLPHSRTALDGLIVELNALGQSSSNSGWLFNTPVKKSNNSGYL